MKSLCCLCLLFFLLSSCRLREAEEYRNQNNDYQTPGGINLLGGKSILTQGMRWNKNEMPFIDYHTALGGMDITVDSEGFLHVVTLSVIFDYISYRYNHVLYYFNNRHGSWNKWELKRQTSSFYFSQSLNGHSSFIELFVTDDEEVQIIYLDSSKNLQLLSYSFGVQQEKRLLTNVSSFNGFYDQDKDELHLAIMDAGNSAKSVSYVRFDSNFLQTERKNYTGEFGSQMDPSHLQLIFYNSRPIILFNSYSTQINRGRFIMIHDDKIFILVNGTDYRAMFNVLMTPDGFKTCYKNAFDDHYELSIDLSQNATSERKAIFTYSNSNRRHCLISSDLHMPYLRFETGIGDSHYLEYYNWPSKGKGIFSGLSLHEIRQIKLLNGKIVVGGLDIQTGIPTLFIKH
jgi:hypothetical protein